MRVVSADSEVGGPRRHRFLSPPKQKQSWILSLRGGVCVLHDCVDVIKVMVSLMKLVISVCLAVVGCGLVLSAIL